jgi:hypothetical protein
MESSYVLSFRNMECCMKKLVIFALLAASLTGCVVAPVGPAPHPGAYWVPGHYGASGYWHPGHWA